MEDLSSLARMSAVNDLGIDFRTSGRGFPHDYWDFVPLKGLETKVGGWNSLRYLVFQTLSAVVCTTVRSAKDDCICRTPGRRAR